MQTLFSYSHSYLHNLYHLGILRSDSLRYRTCYKGFQKGSEEQNGDHTLQNKI